MSFVVTQIKPIMLVAGALTCTMLSAAVTPRTAFRQTFGEELPAGAAELVVRNWGVLIGLIGALLLYGAYDPAARPVILAAAGASKLAFIALLLSRGRRYLRGRARAAVGADLVMVVLFVLYLVQR